MLLINFETKFQIGDVVYNTYQKEHYLIEGFGEGILGDPIYEYRVLETGKTGRDLCKNCDKSKNLIKIA